MVSYRLKWKTKCFIRLFKYVEEVSKLIGNRAWKILEKQILEKRLKWIEKNREKIERIEGNDLEKAFIVFYKLYLGLDLKRDCKIVKKSKRRIIARWKNYCPVLEACKMLGLDTRKVCKLVYEKPTKIFISKISPKVKFRRNYRKIRPYYPYCEEVLELA